MKTHKLSRLFSVFSGLAEGKGALHNSTGFSSSSLWLLKGKSNGSKICCSGLASGIVVSCRIFRDILMFALLSPNSKQLIVSLKPVSCLLRFLLFRFRDIVSVTYVMSDLKGKVYVFGTTESVDRLSKIP